MIQKMAENVCTGKWQKKHTWKMTEKKMHDSSQILGILNRKKHHQSITIKADSNRIMTIQNIDIPKNKTQVQSFLGRIKATGMAHGTYN